MRKTMIQMKETENPELTVRMNNKSDLSLQEIEEYNKVTEKIIGCCIEVHRNLGPGLLESSYEECLCHELNIQGLNYERQLPLSIKYKTVRLDCGYRIDVLVENKIVLEIKSVDEILPIYKAQLLTYMKLSHYKLGLLINFNVGLIKNGIFRMVNNFDKNIRQ
jgi:GxxExxY protein